MLEVKLMLIPIVGFLIGYFTNWIAIKMLFHPKKKIFGIQGILPKRKKILAKKIAEVSPEIMPEYFQKLEKIPFVGNKILELFKNAVENQVNSLSIEDLEELTYKVMKKEMSFVIWMGGVIGLIIGCVQLLIVV
ncbi:MAG: DUF445 family protein, partial [archaeon]